MSKTLYLVQLLRYNAYTYSEVMYIILQNVCQGTPYSIVLQNVLILQMSGILWLYQRHMEYIFGMYRDNNECMYVPRYKVL